MPLMKPEVQQILREAGLSKESSRTSESPISDQLDAAGLSKENVLEELEQIARHSSNEALRLRALETALKAHGALKESAPQTPSFTIVIQNGPSSDSSTSSLPSSVNPILLPRQLLDTFKTNPTIEQSAKEQVN